MLFALHTEMYLTSPGYSFNIFHAAQGLLQVGWLSHGGKWEASALAVDEHTCASQQRAEASLSAAEAEHKVYGAARLKAIAHHCLVFVELFAAVDETLDTSRDSCPLL